MNPPETRYLNRDGAGLAYLVVGEGKHDLLQFGELSVHVDLMMTDPDVHASIERMARIGRVAYIQRRGAGASDQVDYQPTIDQQAGDAIAVMDDLAMKDVTLVGMLTTCGPVALVAARVPERVKGLILINPLPEPMIGGMFPNAWTADELDIQIRSIRRIADEWGTGSTINLFPPQLATSANRRLMALAERCSATPAVVQAQFEWALRTDISGLLKAIQVPTRVVWMPGSPMPESVLRYAASLIPNATFHATPPVPAGTSVGRFIATVSGHAEEVATGTAQSVETDRFLGTVLFTDLVGSTELLASVGDARYSDIRASHERRVRLALEDDGGSLVKVIGDGTLSVFDGPSSAVRCAERICREAEVDGLTVRCGVHTGEVQRDGSDITGMTVHIGARVGAAAGGGEVWVSRTVRDLVVGSGLSFAGRGEHELKGIAGSWELFAVAHAGEQANTVPLAESIQTRTDKVAMGAARRVPGLVRLGARMANAVERRRAR